MKSKHEPRCHCLERKPKRETKVQPQPPLQHRDMCSCSQALGRRPETAPSSAEQHGAQCRCDRGFAFSSSLFDGSAQPRCHPLPPAHRSSLAALLSIRSCSPVPAGLAAGPAPVALSKGAGHSTRASTGVGSWSPALSPLPTSSTDAAVISGTWLPQHQAVLGAGCPLMMRDTSLLYTFLPLPQSSARVARGQRPGQPWQPWAGMVLAARSCLSCRRRGMEGAGATSTGCALLCKGS